MNPKINADRQKIKAAEMWFYRRLLSTSWKEKQTKDSILKQLGVNRELYAAVVKRKMGFFGRKTRSRCPLTTDITQGKKWNTERNVADQKQHTWAASVAGQKSQQLSLSTWL